jgi:hypothetical protein
MMDQTAKIREIAEGYLNRERPERNQADDGLRKIIATIDSFEALPSPDAKEGQAVGFVWTGASGQQYAELTPIPAETTKKVDYYLYRQPATPAPEPEDTTTR